MKQIASLTYLMLGLAISEGQNTFQFTAHLTSTNTDYFADGTFGLTNSLFTYNLQTPAGFFQANIQGPGPDPSAPVIFNLHNTYCVPPLPPDLRGCLFSGSFILSGDQIAQLEAGGWYANAIAINTLRGQIEPVPEPSALNLTGLGLICGLMLLAFRRFANFRVLLSHFWASPIDLLQGTWKKIASPVSTMLGIGLVVFAHAIGICNASAQGAVNFANVPIGYTDSATVDRFVYADFVGGTKLTGTNWVAQLFYGLAGTPVDSLVPLSASPSPFYDASVTSRLGVWAGGGRIMDGIPDATMTTCQVRVWDGSLYPSWESAVTAGSTRGISSVFAYFVPNADDSRPDRYTMYELRAFALNVPEPSAVALVVAGLTGLLLIHHRRANALRRGFDPPAGSRAKRTGLRRRNHWPQADGR